MAEIQRTVSIIFKGIDQTSETLNSISGKFEDASNKIEKATQPAMNLAKAALGAEAAILAVGAAITTLSLKAAGEFDESFREIASLVSQPISELGQFREAILSYAASSTAPMREVTAAIYDAIGSGVPLEQSLKAVAVAEKLSVAGKASLNDTLRVLVSSLNAYGLSTQEAARFSDALFQTVNLGQTTLPELANSLSQVTGTAATLQVPFETVLAAISTLTSLGTPTTQAITAVNAALAGLLKPTSEASKLAEELGISFSAQAVKAQGFETVLRQVAEATGGNEEQIATLFGSVEALRAVFPLTGTAAGKFASDLDSIGNAAGATEAAFAKMSGGITQANQRIANALNGIFITIGTPLLDEFGGIADAVVRIFNTLSVELQRGQLNGIVNYLEETFRDVNDILLRVAANLPRALANADLSGFERGLRTVAEAVSALFDGADLTTAEGLREVLETVADAFLGLSTVAAGVIESLGPLFRFFVEAASAGTELDSSLFKLIGNFAGIGAQINVLIPLLNTLIGVFVLKGASSLLGGITAVSGALSGMIPLLGQAGLVGAAGAAGYGVGTLLADGIDQAVTAISGSEQSLGTWIYELANGAEEAEALGQMVFTAADATRKFDQETQRAAVATADLAENTGAAETETKDLGQTQQVASNQSRALAEYTAATSARMKEQAEAAQKARDSAQKYAIEMEKIASNERIKRIEAIVSINVAQIQRDTETVKAAFESLDNTISSTGDTVASLAGALNQATSSRGFDVIKNALENEINLRNEAFRLQSKLTREQIAILQARRQALESGEALVKIDGAGLQPHLEAFMWEILRTLQTRVNEDGLALLVGADA